VVNTGQFISPSRTSELGCATAKTDTAERIISMGRESLQVGWLGLFFFLNNKRQERIHSFERGSSRSHCVEVPFWKRLLDLSSDRILNK
jgi:hypothetical protein